MPFMKRVEGAGKDQSAFGRSDDIIAFVAGGRRNDLPLPDEEFPPAPGRLREIPVDPIGFAERGLRSHSWHTASSGDLGEQQPGGQPFLLSARPRLLLEHNLHHPGHGLSLHGHDYAVIAPLG